MRASRTIKAVAGIAALAVALVLPSAGGAQAHPAAVAATPLQQAEPGAHDACGPVPLGQAQCLAVTRDDVHGGLGVRGPAAGRDAARAALPLGYSPADLRAAYKLPSTGGKGQTVALVDAGGDPAAESDLAVYRATYGLPACTTANGCFREVNQQGKATPLPPVFDPGWVTEISLDLDMVSAACSSCHILLVEADADTEADLAAAAGAAPSLGATEVSNSYASLEANGLAAYAKDYQHPGVAYLASTGDHGYVEPNVPAVFASVISVGGTSLTRAKNARGWSESAWSGSGSGCSAWVAKPSWQHDTDCPGRTVADVSADADVLNGPAMYDSSTGGWGAGGGTSASAPFIAGVIALAGNPAAMSNASYIYAHTKDLYDVTTGANGDECGGGYLCTAGKGYDGPTGNGTPDGIGAF